MAIDSRRAHILGVVVSDITSETRIATDIDDYIARYPSDVQARLSALGATIRHPRRFRGKSLVRQFERLATEGAQSGTVMCIPLHSYLLYCGLYTVAIAVPGPGVIAIIARSAIRLARMTLGRDALLESEARSYHGPGTCTFYGTAYAGRAAYALGYTGLGVGATRFGASRPPGPAPRPPVPPGRSKPSRWPPWRPTSTRSACCGAWPRGSSPAGGRRRFRRRGGPRRGAAHRDDLRHRGYLARWRQRLREQLAGPRLDCLRSGQAQVLAEPWPDDLYSHWQAVGNAVD